MGVQFAKKQFLVYAGQYAKKYGSRSLKFGVSHACKAITPCPNQTNFILLDTCFGLLPHVNLQITDGLHW